MADMVAPFKVIGPCVSITGSSNNVTNSAILLGNQGDWTLHAFNRNTSLDAYLAYGPNSGAATSQVIPLPGVAPSATGFVVPIPHATIQTFTFSGPTFFSAIVISAGNATLDLTPGTGT